MRFIDHIVLLRNYFSNPEVVFGPIFRCKLRIKLVFAHYNCLRLRVGLIGSFYAETLQEWLILHPHCLKWRKQRATCHVQRVE